MKVLILGATGRTGVYLIEQTLAAGHIVTAFVREAGKLHTQSPRLSETVGDAHSSQDLERALTGQDAILSALGSNKPGDNLILQSTRALIDAMHQTGVRRIIMLSSFLVSPQLKKTGFTRVVSRFTKSLVEDKASGEDLLKQSDLDWTIVYATRLDGAPPGEYRVVDPAETVHLQNAIAREDVAEFMISQLDNADSIQKTLLITSK